MAEADIEAEMLRIGSLRMLSRPNAGGNAGPESGVANVGGFSEVPKNSLAKPVLGL